MGNVWCCCSELETNTDAIDIAYANPAFSNKYKLLRQLGRGSTASCYQCKEITTGSCFAVKFINKKRLSVSHSALLPLFRREIEILQKLDHPNIIQMVEVFEVPTCIHLVTELARGGELFFYLTSRPNHVLTEEAVSFFIRQLFDAVAYIHRHGVIHRDIKLENILLESQVESTEDFRSVRLKLIDFGLSKSFKTKHSVLESIASPSIGQRYYGTLGYLSPEIIRRETATSAIDLWSLGIVTYVLLCGVFPFNDDINPFSCTYALKYPTWASNTSASAHDLLEKLLQVDPKKRLTAEQGLTHPWVCGETASPGSILKSPTMLHSVFGSEHHPTVDENTVDSGMPRNETISPLLLDH